MKFRFYKKVLSPLILVTFSRGQERCAYFGDWDYLGDVWLYRIEGIVYTIMVLPYRL